MVKEILNELQSIRRLLALQKKVLTMDEFCVYAGISKSHAYHLTSTGLIKYYRPVGKLIYFDREDVIDFLMQNPAKVQSQKSEHIFLKTLKH